MALHPFADTTVHRVSACPVCFVWDGRGWGRPLVRLAFLGVVLAGVLHSGVRALSLSPSAVATVQEVAMGVFAISCVGWVVGQAMSRVALWRWQKSRRAIRE
jgi:hypothetical protein